MASIPFPDSYSILFKLPFSGKPENQVSFPESWELKEGPRLVQLSEEWSRYVVESVYGYRDQANSSSLFPLPERNIPKTQIRNFLLLTFYNATIVTDYLGIYFKLVFSSWHVEEASYLRV